MNSTTVVMKLTKANWKHPTYTYWYGQILYKLETLDLLNINCKIWKSQSGINDKCLSDIYHLHFIYNCKCVLLFQFSTKSSIFIRKIQNTAYLHVTIIKTISWSTCTFQNQKHIKTQVITKCHKRWKKSAGWEL